MPTEMGQAERRYTAFPRDQHGRKWEAQYDRFSNAPCSALTPHRWTAPWLPPDKYLRIDPTDDRALAIDYERLIADIARANGDYDRALKTEARKYGVAGASMLEAQTLPDGRKVPHAIILEEVGPPPQSDVFARAARAGNKWVLGVPRPDGSAYPVPPWAAPHLHELEDRYTSTYDDVAADSETFADVEDDDAYAAAPASEFPDVDAYAEFEELHDPAGVGGHTEPVRQRGGRRKAA